jgi:predicted metal-dependent HD superfamily phosphohydrolase
MDKELTWAHTQLGIAKQLLETRHTKLTSSRTKRSRHYNKVAHTQAMIGLMDELLGLMEQDPDRWDDEWELVPF